MKQLLFLLLFPCLAMAQYPGNAGQKITLGEQTTADGLVYRGLAADTTRKPSVDTMAYILLDTNTNIIWQYKKAVNNAWTRVGGSISSGVTGVLPVANGGTGTDTAFTQGSVVFAGASGTYTQDNSGLFFNATNNSLGVNIANPQDKFHIDLAGNEGFSASKTGIPLDSAGFTISNSTGAAGIFQPRFSFINNSNNGPTGGFLQASINNNSIGDVGMRIDARKRITANQVAAPLTIGTVLRVNTFNIPLMSINYKGDMILMSGTATAVVHPTEKLHVVGNARVSGNIAAGVTSATARIQIQAGTNVLAPLKFNDGVNLTTPEEGAMEFNGTNLFFTPSTTRYTVNHGLTGSRTLNFPDTPANSYSDDTIAVEGAAVGDVVSLGIPNAAMSAHNITYTAWVSVAGTVTIRFANHHTDNVDPASGTFKVFVTK